jgi:hypothetical protein
MTRRGMSEEEISGLTRFWLWYFERHPVWQLREEYRK